MKQPPTRFRRWLGYGITAFAGWGLAAFATVPPREAPQTAAREGERPVRSESFLDQMLRQMKALPKVLGAPSPLNRAAVLKDTLAPADDVAAAAREAMTSAIQAYSTEGVAIACVRLLHWLRVDPEAAYAFLGSGYGEMRTFAEMEFLKELGKVARPMSEREKRAAAIKLLEKWAEADLKGALTAAIEADHRGWASEPLRDGLLQELGEVVRHHAEAFIPLIEQRAFGLDTSAVAAVWAGKMGRRDPLLVLSHLEMLPPQSREYAVKSALASTVYHPERIDAIRQSMANLKDTPINRKLKEMAAKQLDP